MSTSTPTGRVRFGDLAAAEWIKIRSLRSTAALMAFGVLFAAGAAWWQGHHVRIAPGAAAFFNPLSYPYDQLTWAFITVLAATFGALAVTGEYASGSIRATFTAAPARREVMLAKSLVVALTMAAFGAAASTAALYAAGAALHGRLSGLSLDQSSALRAAILSAALPVLGSQIGLAIGALVRHPLGAVGATWALILILPTMLASGTIGLADATEATPLSAWMTLAHTALPTANHSPLPTPGIAWTLISAWLLLALAATTEATARRDV